MDSNGSRAAVALFLVTFAAAPTCQAEPPAAQLQLQRDVLPLLRARCVKCHGPAEREAELNLSTPAGLARGGENGVPVAPGDLASSLLWQRVAAEEMPPEEPLPADEKALLRKWIEQGAVGLSAADKLPSTETDHWAFRPLERPPVADVAGPSNIHNDVDRFLLAELRQKGLSFSPPADRATLLRRVALDLTGLPPTVEEIATFLADPAPDAHERMVERYLASPHYGQRWGRHWLDVAGYADSNGYFHADTDRPLAYRYRDYVIRSFNDDKPFDRFIHEQLAGDQIVGYQPGGDITPEMVGPLVATHFLRNAQDGTGESDGNPLERHIDRMSVIEGNVRMVGSALLGLSLQCARCHDHKFEPVTQLEYYRLQAVFASAYNLDHWRQPDERVADVGTQAELTAHQAAHEQIDRQIEQAKRELEEFAALLREKLRQTRLAELDTNIRGTLSAALDVPADDRTEEQRQLLGGHTDVTEIDDDELAREFAEFATRRNETDEAIAASESERPPPPARISILFESTAETKPHHLLVRGDYKTPGEVAAPGAPAVLSSDGNVFSVLSATDGNSPSQTANARAEFARWITDPRHPTLARITVNRIWQRHFGRGIVATPDNLGLAGAVPSHPELLDYLAAEFTAGGWSVKALHRLIVNSAAYRQQSVSRPNAGQPDGEKVDPGNQLLWKYPLRRLDAECVRDAMLAVSGELDGRAGGPYVPTERIVGGEVVVAANVDGARRRSVYLQQRRTQVLSMLDVFDAPGIVTNCTRRATSTTSLQSLSLLNSDFVNQCATALAARVDREVGANSADRVARALLLIVGRGPRESERTAALRFLTEQPAEYAGEEDAQDRAWVDLCRTLLASNAFLYVE